jgi:uncharacterized YccA/Bax inhibitor family protein
MWVSPPGPTSRRPRGMFGILGRSRATLPGDMTLATTSNPAFSEKVFAGYDQVYGTTRTAVMTVQGTIGKTFALLAILSATAIYSWNATASGDMQPVVLPAAAIGGLVLAMVTIFRPQLAPWTAPVYAAFEGVALGAFSFVIEHVFLKGKYPGIALQAVSMTTGTLFVMLFLYQSRIIRVTDRLRAGIITATGAIFLVYLISMVVSLFGGTVPFIRSTSGIGVGFSVFVVGLAAFNLLLDFDFIEKAARSGQAPKSMEWYGAFGLMVTLVWLYIEILELLRKLSDRR